LHLVMLSLKKSRQRFLLSLFRMSSLTLVIMGFSMNLQAKPKTSDCTWQIFLCRRAQRRGAPTALGVIRLYTNSSVIANRCRGGSVNRPLSPGVRPQCDSTNSIIFTTAV